MRDLKTACGVACQIVYEYPDWGVEHVADMHATYRACGEPAPCSGDKLYDLTIAAARLKKAGLSYDAAEKKLYEENKNGKRKISRSV